MSFPIAMQFLLGLTDAHFGVYVEGYCRCSGFASRADAHEWAKLRGIEKYKVKVQ